MSVSSCEKFVSKYALNNYVLYPNKAENVFFIAELDTEVVPVEIGIANTNNGGIGDR